MSIIGNYFTRKREIINIEELKKQIKNISLGNINRFLKTEFLEKNITILGNVKG